ncbi:MAG TPA: CD225/dispanin family protein [Candidatus Mediterraneibacter merdavium]|nr:CD225/dispanin family protein [Candidatus Mediterraneibacter merdavium]
MNCIKCYQEIPEDSRFCPYCGAEQTVTPQTADAQINPVPESGADAHTDAPAHSEADTHTETAAQSDSPVQDTAVYPQPEASYQNTQNYGPGPQDTSGYGAGYQGGYQSNAYQQDQGQPVNWVPYLVLSIVSTLCCCPPFGIVAIIFSAKINSAMNEGNTEEARKSARTAKIWLIVAFVAGIISYILYFVLIGFIGAAGYYYY